MIFIFYTNSSVYMNKVIDCAWFCFKKYAVIYIKIMFIFTHGVNNIFDVRLVIYALICIFNLLMHEFSHI